MELNIGFRLFMTGRSEVTFPLSTVLVLISLLMGSSPKVSYGIAMGVHPNQNISNSILQKTKQASQHILKIAYDKFGIEKIYPTKPSGQEWFMNMSDPIDYRTGGETPQTTFVGKNMPDGSWKLTSKEVRFGLLTSLGYRPDLITTLNQTELAEKGYMQSPND